MGIYNFNGKIEEKHFKKINCYIKVIRMLSPKINKLFENLQKNGQVVIIGGAIRDIIVKKKPRDIDLIVTTNDNLDILLDEFKFTKNRFGGYKITIDNIKFDIWHIQDNWAFKNNIYEAKLKNINLSTFFNFDAILFNVNTKKGNADFFNKAISKKEIDITLKKEYIDENPTPEINILRCFVISKEWQLDYSKTVENYISKWINKAKNPFKELMDAQYKHYGENIKIKEETILDEISYFKKRCMNLYEFEEISNL